MIINLRYGIETHRKKRSSISLKAPDRRYRPQPDYPTVELAVSIRSRRAAATLTLRAGTSNAQRITTTPYGLLLILEIVLRRTVEYSLSFPFFVLTRLFLCRCNFQPRRFSISNGLVDFYGHSSMLSSRLLVEYSDSRGGIEDQVLESLMLMVMFVSLSNMPVKVDLTP